MPTMVSGIRATSDLSTYRLRVDLADKISLLNPNANPFVLLSKKVGKVTATQPKHSWLEDELRPDKDQINYTTAYSSVASALTVDHGSYFAAGDLVQVFDHYEILKVLEVSSNILYVTRNWPGVASTATGYNAALADNDWLIRLGNVNEEGATAPSSVTTTETQVDNYTQIFRTPFELTETELNSLMHGDADLPYQTRKKGIEHARDIEKTFFWGIPSSANTGASSKPQRSMGGLWYFLKENAPAANIVSQAEITKAEFLDFIRNGFRYGSSRKVLFACPLVMSAIESWGLADLITKSSDKTYGISISNWVSPHGEIALINHKLLEGPNPGTAGGWNFLLDMEQVKYVALRNRDTKLLTNRQAPDQDSYEAEYLTEASLEVKLPEHHAVLYNVTSFAA